MSFTLSQNKFKSASFIFSKIKRELSSLHGVGKIDEADFALYTAEVLKELGCANYKESEAILTVKDGKANLPKDFMLLYAAYKCHKSTDEINELHFQRGYFLLNDITCEVLGQSNKCKLDCGEFDKVLQKITVREYVGNDVCRVRGWEVSNLLTLSPNVHDLVIEHSPNFHHSCADEISISDGQVFTNFKKCDIFLQYYAFPFDEDGAPMIPDIIQVEKAVEFYIKYQLFLNYWLDGSVPDIQNKLGKLEQLYKEALGEAKFINKLPGFQTMLHSAKMKRKLNSASFFAQMDRKNN